MYEGEPLSFNGWQLYCTANHYRVRPGAVADPRRLLAAFYYRRSVIVGPQKCGKSPWGAGMLLAEGVGVGGIRDWIPALIALLLVVPASWVTAVVLVIFVLLALLPMVLDALERRSFTSFVSAQR